MRTMEGVMEKTMTMKIIEERGGDGSGEDGSGGAYASAEVYGDKRV